MLPGLLPTCVVGHHSWALHPIDRALSLATNVSNFLEFFTFWLSVWMETNSSPHPLCNPNSLPSVRSSLYELCFLPVILKILRSFFFHPHMCKSVSKATHICWLSDKEGLFIKRTCHLKIPLSPHIEKYFSWNSARYSKYKYKVVQEFLCRGWCVCVFVCVGKLMRGQQAACSSMHCKAERRRFLHK